MSIMLELAGALQDYYLLTVNITLSKCFDKCERASPRQKAFKKKSFFFFRFLCFIKNKSELTCDKLITFGSIGQRVPILIFDEILLWIYP